MKGRERDKQPCFYPGCEGKSTSQHQNRPHFYCFHCRKSFIKKNPTDHTARHFLSLERNRKTREFKFEIEGREYYRTRAYILQCREPQDIAAETNFPDRMKKLLLAHNIDLQEVPFLEGFLHPDNQFLDEAGERMEEFGSKNDQPRLCELKHWKSIPDFPEVAIKVNVDFWKLQSKPPCYRNETALDKDESEQEFSRLMTKINLPSADTDSYIFNLPTPSLDPCRLNPPGFMQSYQNLQEPSGLMANVTPSQLCVDLHHGTLMSIDTLFGPPKIWLFYPQSPHNLSVLSGRYGHNNRLKSCFNKLKGGVVFQQKHGQTIILPPYTLHATFSVGSNILVGWTMETLEYFPRRLINFQLDYNHIRVENVANKTLTIKRRDTHARDVLEDLDRALEVAPPEHLAKIKDVWSKTKVEILPYLTGNLRTKAAEIWERELSKEGSGLADCPLCDWTDVRGGELSDHWKEHHKTRNGDEVQQQGGPGSNRPGKRTVQNAEVSGRRKKVAKDKVAAAGDGA